MQGVQAVSDMDLPGKARDTISESISDGIEDGVMRVQGPLLNDVMGRTMRMGITLLLFFVGLFFLSFGVSKVIDFFSPYPGVGAALVGVFFLLLGVLELKMRG